MRPFAPSTVKEDALDAGTHACPVSAVPQPDAVVRVKVSVSRGTGGAVRSVDVAEVTVSPPAFTTARHSYVASDVSPVQAAFAVPPVAGTVAIVANGAGTDGVRSNG